MRQVVILVEGQTEEKLVNEVLSPAASMRGTYVTPVVVTTSATPTGAHHGGGHWKHYHAKLQSLLKASHWERVGLLLDYYQYPKGAPGRDAECRNHGEHQRAITRAGGPEKVNNGPSTSPSKRLARASRHYDKVMTGPGLIADAGLSAILERCPVFAAWWEDLLA